MGITREQAVVLAEACPAIKRLWNCLYRQVYFYNPTPEEQKRLDDLKVLYRELLQHAELPLDSWVEEER